LKAYRKIGLLVIKISAVIAGLVLIFIISAFSILYFFEDKIIAGAVKEINTRLTSKISVDKIEISIIKKFPQASLEFKNIKCIGSNPNHPEKELINAGSIFLVFNVWDAFGDEFTFKRIEINNATINVIIDEKNQNNYSIFKEANIEKSEQNKSSKQAFALNKVELKNVVFNYINLFDTTQYALSIKEFLITGKFTETIHTSSMEGNFMIDRIQLKGIDYVLQKNCKINTAFENNSPERRITLQETKISIENLHLTASGIIQTDSTGYVDLKIKSDDIGIQSFISLLPEKWRAFENKYKSDGNFYVEGSIQGNTAHHIPDISVSFGIRNGDILYQPQKIQMREVNLIGKYILQNDASYWELKMDGIKGKMNQSSIQGSFIYNSLKENNLQLTTQSQLDLKEIFSFIPIPGITDLSGNASIKIKYKGTARMDKKYSIQDFQSSISSGEVIFKNVSIAQEKQLQPFKNINGTLKFNNINTEVQQLGFLIGSSDVLLNGTIINLPAYLFVENSPLTIRGNVSSNHFILHELFSTKEKDSTETNKSELKQRLPSLVNMELVIDIKKLEMNRFIANDTKGILYFKNKAIHAENISLKAEQGLVRLDGMIGEKKEGELFLLTNLELENINLKQLFFEFDNFKQQALTSEQVNGTMNAEMQLKLNLNDNMEIDRASIQMQSNISIVNGELINLPSLESLSKFIKLADLKNVKFDKLTNQINIENKKINIPDMEIKSSALNLSLSGSHTFDNEIDYRFSVLLKDVLSQQYKTTNTQAQFGDVIEDDSKAARMFIRMSGTVEKPIISYDGFGVKEKIKKDMNEEKNTLKQILYEEFGIFKNDKNIQHEATPEAIPKKKNTINSSEEFEFEY
jgi:hypothetical protein